MSALEITEFPVKPDAAAKTPAGRDIFIDISGDGFLYNMVRIIAGTLIETGLGKRRPEDMKTVIEGLDRTAAGFTAPPQGLTLMEVFYDVF